MSVMLSGKQETDEGIWKPGRASFVSIMVADLIEKEKITPGFQV